MTLRRFIKLSFYQRDLPLNLIAHSVELRVPNRCFVCVDFALWYNQFGHLIEQQISDHFSGYTGFIEKRDHLLKGFHSQVSFWILEKLRQGRIAVRRWAEIIHSLMIPNSHPSMQISAQEAV